MLDCTTPKYDDLYARWLEDPWQLPVMAKWVRDEPLLDLCGGTGVVSKALLVPQPFGTIPKPRVVLFDYNPRAGDWAEAQENNGRFEQVCGDANDVDLYFSPEYFGVVICRQAMGYLDLDRVMPAVARILKPGGRFVFNTFNTPKPLGVKAYYYKNQHYLEAHVSLFHRVLHFQVKVSGKPGADVSLFKFHTINQIRKAAEPWFDVECQTAGQSVRWICTRKK